jgi:hypothetical protein
MSTVAVRIKDVDPQYGDLRIRIELLREGPGVRLYPAGYKHPTRMNGCGRSARCHASFDKTERR